MTLTFAALDVETANANRGSVCAFGVVVVRDGEVVERHHLLTRPPAQLDWFDGFNVSLHGIRPQDVEAGPSFQQRLQQVLAIVGDLPVVAHNASFDVGAIRSGCDADALEWPTLTYGCSLVMARRAGLELLSYRLPLVCDALGVPLATHHQAGEDAEAAARVVLALAARTSSESLESLAAALMVRLGRITHSEWAACIRGIAAMRPHPDLDADPDHPLYGKHVAFTGALSITRANAWGLIAALGSTPQPSPTRVTDFLVIGDGFTGTTAAEFHTGRSAKAIRVNAKGGHVEVLTEGDFLQMLQETRTSGVRQEATPV